MWWGWTLPKWICFSRLLTEPKLQRVWPRGPLLDPRYSNRPYYIRKKWEKKRFTKRKGQEQSTYSQNNGGGCSVDQSPDTSSESADVQDENTSETKRVKFILKPSKKGVKVLHQMQQATLQAARVLSQQLKGNVEIVDKSEVVDLVGPANETEIILNGKKVNSLLDSGSQVTSVSESYYREHLSQYPLQPVDVPGLLLQPAGGGSMPYLRMIITSLKVPHLTSTFQAKVVVVPDTEYHYSTPASVGTLIIRRSRDECRQENGNNYLQRMKVPSSWVRAYEYVNAADKSSRSAKTLKSVRIQPKQTLKLPVAIRTNATFKTTNMMVELNSNINGIEFMPSIVTLKNNSSLERISLPVTNTSNRPCTIQADKVLFSLEPLLNIKEAHNVQYQSTTCLTQMDKEREDLIKKLSAMTKLEGEQRKQYPNGFRFIHVIETSIKQIWHERIT